MNRDPRRLFKRPRNPRQWPRRAYVLVAGLILTVAIIMAFAVIVRPTEFPPTMRSDQWAAEGVAFGVGAFIFAVVATVLATIAYINSTEKPVLRLEASYPGKDQPAGVGWTARGKTESGKTAAIAEYMTSSLLLRIHNDGPIAARFLAVRVTFGEGTFLNATLNAPWQPVSTTSIQTDQAQFSPAVSVAQWDGGADVVVHPTWDYQLPPIAGAGPNLLFTPVSRIQGNANLHRRGRRG